MDGRQDFPLLGLPTWPAGRGLAVRGGTGHQQDSVVHSYLPDHNRRSAPCLVIGQSITQPQTEAVRRAVFGSGNRRQDSRIQATTSTTAMVEGVRLAVQVTQWADPRMQEVAFSWRSRFHICIASWDYHLDNDFFAALETIRESI
jgi:hypothetical protein